MTVTADSIKLNRFSMHHIVQTLSYYAYIHDLMVQLCKQAIYNSWGTHWQKKYKYMNLKEIQMRKLNLVLRILLAADMVGSCCCFNTEKDELREKSLLNLSFTASAELRPTKDQLCTRPPSAHISVYQITYVCRWANNNHCVNVCHMVTDLKTRQVQLCTCLLRMNRIKSLYWHKDFNQTPLLDSISLSQ